MRGKLSWLSVCGDTNTEVIACVVRFPSGVFSLWSQLSPAAKINFPPEFRGIISGGIIAPEGVICCVEVT